MKKVLLIAVLFCIASTPVIMAQSTRTVTPKKDPAYSLSQQQRDQQIMRDEANRKNQPAFKTEQSKTHMATPPRVKTADNEKVFKQEIKKDDRSQTFEKKSNYGKKNTVGPAKEEKTLKADDKNLSKDKKDVDRKARELNRAKRRMEQAKARLSDKQRVLDELMKAQAAERTSLEERFARESANGLTDDMRLRQNDERQKMDTRHSRELMDAQQAVEKALRDYNAAESRVIDASK